jgi:hydrogenase-4 component F
MRCDQEKSFAQKLLIFAGLLSLAVAAIYIWRNRNYKRLLAYSSVEHLGIIALGVGIGGVALLGAVTDLLRRLPWTAFVWGDSVPLYRRHASVRYLF